MTMSLKNSQHRLPHEGNYDGDIERRLRILRLQRKYTAEINRAKRAMERREPSSSFDRGSSSSRRGEGANERVQPVMHEELPPPSIPPSDEHKTTTVASKDQNDAVAVPGGKGGILETGMCALPVSYVVEGIFGVSSDEEDEKQEGEADQDSIEEQKWNEHVNLNTIHRTQDYSQSQDEELKSVGTSFSISWVERLRCKSHADEAVEQKRARPTTVYRRVPRPQPTRPKSRKNQTRPRPADSSPREQIRVVGTSAPLVTDNAFDDCSSISDDSYNRVWPRKKSPNHLQQLFRSATKSTDEIPLTFEIPIGNHLNIARRAASTGRVREDRSNLSVIQPFEQKSTSSGILRQRRTRGQSLTSSPSIITNSSKRSLSTPRSARTPTSRGSSQRRSRTSAPLHLQMSGSDDESHAISLSAESNYHTWAAGRSKLATSWW